MGNKHKTHEWRCPWCQKLLANKQGIDAHTKAKHHNPLQMPRTEEWDQVARMQHYHQDKLANAK